MISQKNRQILLASRPLGEPTPDNFKLVEAEVPEPGPASEQGAFPCSVDEEAA
jgi:NADPH-dependent curcumin reductase CurA